MVTIPNLSNCVYLTFVVLADYQDVVLAQAKFRWLFSSKVLRVKSRTETYSTTVRAICSRLQDSKESAPRKLLENRRELEGEGEVEPVSIVFNTSF